MIDNKIDHLLACLGEECGEVQQVVGKMLRFGHNNIHRRTKIKHIRSLQEEVLDVAAVFDMLVEAIGEEHFEIEMYKDTTITHYENKQDKVQDYIDEMEWS